MVGQPRPPTRWLAQTGARRPSGEVRCQPVKAGRHDEGEDDKGGSPAIPDSQQRQQHHRFDQQSPRENNLQRCSKNRVLLLQNGRLMDQCSDFEGSRDQENKDGGDALHTSVLILFRRFSARMRCPTIGSLGHCTFRPKPNCPDPPRSRVRYSCAWPYISRSEGYHTCCLRQYHLYRNRKSLGSLRIYKHPPRVSGLGWELCSL